MTCSTCDKSMFVILFDRAFCDEHYEQLQAIQRMAVLNFPRKPRVSDCPNVGCEIVGPHTHNTAGGPVQDNPMESSI